MPCLLRTAYVNIPACLPNGLQAEEMRAKDAVRAAKSRQLADETRAANSALQQFRIKEAERAKEQELAIDGEREGRHRQGKTRAG